MSRTLTISQIPGKPGQVYYPLKVTTRAIPKPGPGQLLVKLHAAALNHRDFFIRQHLYPGVSFENPLLADGHGTVVAVGAGCSDAARRLLHQAVLLTPSHGWDADPTGPENPDPRAFVTVGGSAGTPLGAAQDYAVLPQGEVEACPPHLTPAQGAALPLVGLTGWRALVTKCGPANTAPGCNLLVTGIGGGVALQVLQFAVALGCRVFVTSGSDDKLARACALGAAGGVSYKDDKWDRALQRQLPADRPFLDAVVDGAGGDIVGKTVRLLKPGGIISIYGMTTGPRMDWLMQAVLRNVELRGTTMGSRAEFRDMVAFVREKRIVPVVSRTVKGLNNIAGIDSLFEDMRDGKQFGKLVIEISEPESAKTAKL
jgi:NADPH:quinone reductase-like Zn-dependent oxidoreductase